MIVDRTIMADELISKLKNGDLIYYSKDGIDGGWKMVVGNGWASLDSRIWSHKVEVDNVSKVIFLENARNNQFGVSHILSNGDESFTKDIITKVLHKSEKEQQLEDLIKKLSSQLDDAVRELEDIKGK
jgi:hypothetical protein